MKKSLPLLLLFFSFSQNIYSEDNQPLVAEWRDTYFDQMKENIKKADIEQCKGWEPFKKWLYAQVMLQFFPYEIKTDEQDQLKKDAGNLAPQLDLKGMLFFLHDSPKDMIKKFICQLPEKVDVNPTITYVYIFSQIYAPKHEPGQRNDKVNPSGVGFSLKQAFGN